jgi:hypothetical protein
MRGAMGPLLLLLLLVSVAGPFDCLLLRLPLMNPITPTAD